MNTKRYQLRLHGLHEHGGEIKAADLARTLNALHKAVESATRLVVSGEGRRKRVKPAWLAASTDFTVTGLTSGSTVVAIAAGRLVDAPSSPFRRGELHPNHVGVDADDTAIDLAARAICEAQVPDSPGDCFDDAVLDAIVELGKSVRAQQVSYSLVRNGESEARFFLSRRACSRIVERKKAIPVPKAYIVSGWVEQVAHSSGQFRLEVSNGQSLNGRLHADANDVELLRPLWGRQATVQGIVHFKANGQPRLIEAQRISAGQPGDHLFAEIPHSDQELPRPQPRRTEQGPRAAKPADLVGTWPGEEPVEDLLQALGSKAQ